MKSNEEESSLALISEADLSLTEANSLNAKQLQILLTHTPERYVRQRPAKGGGTWDYVTGGYVKRVLNLMFGWDWDFEIVDHLIRDGEVIVKGKLTCRTNGHIIVKMQYGNKDIIYKKQGKEDKEAGKPLEILSIGNDLKSAATDALKKCASEIGIASDIYNSEEFREFTVQPAESKYDWDGLRTSYEAIKAKMTEAERTNAERIISTQEENSYTKLTKKIKKYESE